MSDALTALTVMTAVGCALNGGVFFAFSTFVMQGLGRLAPSQGVAAMQAINITAVTFAFMTALFGTAVLCLAVAVWAFADWSDASPYLLAGAVVYLAGNIAVTIVYNVPRNDALAALDPEDPGSAAYWQRYLREWTAGNHVRTVTGLAAAALLIVALL